MEKHYSCREISNLLGVHETTIWRWVREERLPAPRKISKSCSRWPESALAEFGKAERACELDKAKPAGSE